MRKYLIALCCLIVLFIISSCKKDEGQGKSDSNSIAISKKIVEKTVEKTQENNLQPILLELPRPIFVGTPQNIRVPNLQKPAEEPRPPFMAPEGTVNVALNKPVSSSSQLIIIGELDMVTDGDKRGAEGSYIELAPFLNHITIDLKKKCEIFAIVMWHYHKQARVYKDVVVHLSNDPDFIIDVTTIFNNDHNNSAGLGVGDDMHYVETFEGKLINAKGYKARYVRLYSNGNTSNDLNNYVEVEVYGRIIE